MEMGQKLKDVMRTTTEKIGKVAKMDVRGSAAGSIRFSEGVDVRGSILGSAGNTESKRS